MPSTHAVVLNGVQAIYADLVTEGRSLDAAAKIAEDQNKETADIGLSETRKALEAVYRLTCLLAELTEDQRRRLMTDPALQPTGSPPPISQSLKSDKRRFSSPAILAALCIMPTRDKGSRSKASTVCAAALSQKKETSAFDDWLLDDHCVGGQKDGKRLGPGYTNAYNAYKKPRKSPVFRSEVAERREPSQSVISEEEFEAIARELFKLALTDRELVRAPNECSYKGVFGVWVRSNGNGTSDYTIQLKSGAIIQQELRADRKQRALAPFDTRAHAPGAASAARHEEPTSVETNSDVVDRNRLGTEG